MFQVPSEASIDRESDDREPNDREPNDRESSSWRDRLRFVESNRATSVCGRELALLGDGIVERFRARSSASAGELPVPVVSQSPGRCVVQLGPVALTLAWLRAQFDTVSHGELLVVVWEGSVGRGTRKIPERAAVPRVASARVLWEDVFVVEATDEASWRWHSTTTDLADCTTLALVDRCVEQLMHALDERREDGAHG